MNGQNEKYFYTIKQNFGGIFWQHFFGQNCQLKKTGSPQNIELFSIEFYYNIDCQKHQPSITSTNICQKHQLPKTSIIP
jgi:hypothetical protein